MVCFSCIRAFRKLNILLLCRKIPWRLSTTRKANVRKRLRAVDSVIEAVRASGVECGSLVRPQSLSW